MPVLSTNGRSRAVTILSRGMERLGQPRYRRAGP